MKNCIILLILTFLLKNTLYSQSKIYIPIAFFKKSQIDQNKISELIKRDSIEESRMIGDGKPPFKFVEKQEIVNVFTSPKIGVNEVYLMVSTEKIEENKPPFLGHFLHTILCIEVDKNEKFVSGYSYPLEYSMHFLTGEIKKINISDEKFKHMAKVNFLDKNESSNYVSSGVLDLSLLDLLKETTIDK